MGGVLTSLLLALLFSFASCDNGSTSSPQKDYLDIDYSLGTTPAENLKFENENFSISPDEEGIYIKYTLPQGQTVQSCTARIDGIGLVHENFGLEGQSEGELFYPFVTPGKEYKVRFIFNKPEKKDPSDDRFTVYDDGETMVGWFETTVKAGANSKGEVRLEKGGAIDIDKNGDFKFKERPNFRNEDLLTGSGYDWIIEIGLNKGISWMHGDKRRSWWMTTATIPQTKITETRNLYSHLSQDDAKIDFICVRPAMQYEHNGKEYRYLWDNIFVKDCDCTALAELLTEIDISSQANKIVGTWRLNYEGLESRYDIKVYEITLTIDSENVRSNEVVVYQKRNGDEFTEKEKEEFDVGKDGTSISSDNKTITAKYSETEPISEYFADEKYDHPDYTRHYTVKLFKGGSTLRIIRSGINEGEKYEWWDDYKKVK